MVSRTQEDGKNFKFTLYEGESLVIAVTKSDGSFEDVFKLEDAPNTYTFGVYMNRVKSFNQRSL